MIRRATGAQGFLACATAEQQDQLRAGLDSPHPLLRAGDPLILGDGVLDLAVLGAGYRIIPVEDHSAHIFQADCGHGGPGCDIAIVLANMRDNPRSSNPWRINSRAPSLARPCRQ